PVHHGTSGRPNASLTLSCPRRKSVTAPEPEYPKPAEKMARTCGRVPASRQFMHWRIHNDRATRFRTRRCRNELEEAWGSCTTRSAKGARDRATSAEKRRDRNTASACSRAAAESPFPTASISCCVDSLACKATRARRIALLSRLKRAGSMPSPDFTRLSRAYASRGVAPSRSERTASNALLLSSVPPASRKRFQRTAACFQCLRSTASSACRRKARREGDGASTTEASCRSYSTYLRFSA